MSIKATVIIKKESFVDANTKVRTFHATLSLLDEAGQEYGAPVRLTGYQQAGDLLQREAGVTYEQMQDRIGLYEKGEDVRLLLTLANEQAIRNLGFKPRA
jgi:hypothetical protein